MDLTHISNTTERTWKRLAVCDCSSLRDELRLVARLEHRLRIADILLLGRLRIADLLGLSIASLLLHDRR